MKTLFNIKILTNHSQLSLISKSPNHSDPPGNPRKCRQITKKQIFLGIAGFPGGMTGILVTLVELNPSLNLVNQYIYRAALNGVIL